MPKLLKQKDMDELANDLDLNNRIAYYRRLIDFGYSEARLSCFVATDTTLIGRFANRFAESVAISKDIDLSASDWVAIGNELMEADFGMRMDRFNAASPQNGADVSLTYDDYRAFHRVVFERPRCRVSNQDVALGIKAWSSELLIGDAPTHLTHPMWRKLSVVPEERRRQIFALRHTANVFLRDSTRSFDVRGQHLVKAGRFAVSALKFELLGDKNFYDPTRIRPKPKPKPKSKKP